MTMQSTITDNVVSSGARHLFHALKDRARGKNWPECWPSKGLLADDIRKSVRMVQYYLRELEAARVIEIIHGKRNKNRYRILVALNERLPTTLAEQPLQPIAEQPLQPIAEQPLQPIAEFDISSIIGEAFQQQAAQETEVSAAAAGEISLGDEMQETLVCLFDQLVELGMPATPEMSFVVKNDQALALIVLGHCKKRFSGNRNKVESRGGYIVSFLRDPAKFGFLQRDGRWQSAEKRSGMSDEERARQEAARKAMNQKDLSRRQADDEKHYADMAGVWQKLPEEAKQEIREVVLKDSPLFHGGGADKQECELQCMREAFAFKRHAWRKRLLG